MTRAIAVGFWTGGFLAGASATARLAINTHLFDLKREVAPTPAIACHAVPSENETCPEGTTCFVDEDCANAQPRFLWQKRVDEKCTTCRMRTP